MVAVVKAIPGARVVPEPDAMDPLMQPVEWQGQLYYTTRYFHRQYLTHMAEQGRKVTHKRFDNFQRKLRGMPIYHLLVEHSDIIELCWDEGRTSNLRSLFRALQYNPITLLNATAQLELTHHLDDEPSKTLAYALDKLVAEVLTVPALQQIKQTTEVIKALRELVAEAGPCVHSVGGARAPVAMCWCQDAVEGYTGAGLRSLVSGSAPPLVSSSRSPQPRTKHAFPLTPLMPCVQICRRHGLPFTVQELTFASQEEVINWMIATQLGRRNLTPGQKSYLRGKRYNLEKKKEGAPPGNQNATNQRAENRHIDSERTSERLADEYNVAPSTIRADAEFADAVDTLEDQVRADIRETVLKRQRNGTGATTKKQTVAAAKAVKAHTVEPLPFMQRQGWKPYQVLEAITILEALPQREHVPLNAMLDEPFIPGEKGLGILRNLAAYAVAPSSGSPPGWGLPLQAYRLGGRLASFTVISWASSVAGCPWDHLSG
jgi:hypothetical protein